MFECNWEDSCENYQEKCVVCKRNILIGQIVMGNKDYYVRKGELQRQKARFKVGDFVSFESKKVGTVIGKLIRKNPKYAKLDCGEKGLWKIPYSILNLANAEASNYVETQKVVLEKPKEKNPTLIELMEKVKEEYAEIFMKIFTSSQKLLLSKVTIKWNKRITFRLAGRYKRKTNEVTISISLRGVPKEVIKKVIFHELLHIHFHNHSRTFRLYERKFKSFDYCNDYISELFKKIMKRDVETVRT